MIQTIALTFAVSMIGILFAIYILSLAWFIVVKIPLSIWNYIKTYK
jgi:hypothetical protein